MKNFLILAIIMTLLLVTTACSAPANETASPAQVEETTADDSPSKLEKPESQNASLAATLGEFSGDVQARADQQAEFAAASLGEALYLNGQVQTGADGRARLDFSDGTLVRVSPDTLFTVALVEDAGGGLLKSLSMTFGRLWVVLNGGSLEVETPSGVASVRGSYMMVEQDPDTGDMTVTCLEGTCTLEVNGEVITLTAGQKAWLSGGELGSGVMSQEEIQAWIDSVPEAELVLQEVPGSVGDLVWLDMNGNGTQDDGEPGVAGVTVNLMSGSDVLASTQTDTNGKYLFENVFTGEYSLQFQAQDAIFTVQNGGDDSLNNDAGSDGLTQSFSLNPGEHRTDLDAGLVNLGGAAVCPLTGLPVADASLLDNRPIFVSISQFPAWASRPSTGLNSAPVVFETLLNEGQTRLQALFYCGYPESTANSQGGSDFSAYEISGVRSGRIFYGELAKLFGAGLIFGGASAEVYDEIAPYQCSSLQNTDTPSNTGGGGVNIDRLEAVAENCQTASGNTDLGVWQFGPAPDGGTPVESFLMKYNYLNQTRWVYDPTAGGYVRYQNDPNAPEDFTLSTDRLTGEAIVRQNIILLVTPHQVLNSTGTIINFDLTDTGGYAYLLRDGAIHKACWSTIFGDYPETSNRYRPFLLTDCATGEQINMAYGSTWVNVVDPSVWFQQKGDDYVATQPFLGYGD